LRTRPLFWVLAVFSIAAAAIQNPVLPGDHPDPSVIRFGGEYWAVNTSSDWGPIFSLSSSKDLAHWTLRTHVFADLPAWADNWFWAPELYTEKNRVRLYYTAQMRGGPLCVAVATAGKPAGPWTDGGPLVCQADGAIDPFFTRDDKGKGFLLWKKNGNGASPASIIYLQPTTDDGLHMTGSPRELIRSDVPWEVRDVEAPDIVRHGGYFYMLYAGGFCCGVNCNYGVGVARAKDLQGAPWEKNPANPIVTSGPSWRCPGHGTAVNGPDGQEYFLYHAYSKRGFIATGREAVLDKITWKDGWPVIGEGRTPAPETAAEPAAVHDDFRAAALQPFWEWPVQEKPQARVGGGTLTLSSGTAGFLGAILAEPLDALNYSVETDVVASSVAPGAAAGLAIIGDRQTAAGVALQGGRIVQWRIDGGKWTKLADDPAPVGDKVRLRIEGRNANRFQMLYSKPGGAMAASGKPVDVGSLAPWSRDLRVALFAGGAKGGQFTSFDLRYGAGK